MILSKLESAGKKKKNPFDKGHINYETIFEILK